MNLRWPTTVLIGVVVIVASSHPFRDASAAETDGAASASEEAAYTHPINLTVLPKDTPAAKLKALMRRYGEELGVQCEHCHVEDPQSHRFDYASDENPKKQTARLMMAMLTDINTKYLSQLGDPRYAARVTCGNCHQGQTDPPAYEAAR